MSSAALPLVLAPLTALASAPPASPQDASDAPEWPQGRFGAYLDEIGVWEQPSDVVLTRDGAIAFVEAGGHRVVVLAPEERPVIWGSLGDGPDQLDRPQGLALDGDGNLWVADTGNDRVRAFDQTGRPLGGFGGLHRPMGLCVVGEDVAVADTGNRRVVVCDRDGTVKRELRGFERPVDVAADPSGNLYVVDGGAHRVSVHDPEGKADASWGDFGPEVGLFGHPSGIAWHDGRVYVSDADNHRIQVFEPDGTPIYEWGRHALRPGEGEGSLHYPTSIAIAPDASRAVVAEASQDRLQVFGPTEEDPRTFMTDPMILPWKVSPHYGMPAATVRDLLALIEPETQNILVFDLELEEPVEMSRFGGYGSLPGTFRELSGLALDARTWTLWASDRGARTLSAFKLDHDPDAPLRQRPDLATFARSVSLDAVVGDGCDPGEITLGPGGGLFVCDMRNGRILSLSAELKLVGTLGAGALDEPVDLAWDPERKLLHVVDAGTREVVTLDAAGALLERRRLGAPHGVALDANGTLYVTDPRTHSVRTLPPRSTDQAPGIRWGREGLGKGEMRRPRGLVVDERGRVIVVDHGNHRGCIFDPDGTFRHAFGPRLYVKPTRR